MVEYWTIHWTIVTLDDLGLGKFLESLDNLLAVLSEDLFDITYYL